MASFKLSILVLLPLLGIVKMRSVDAEIKSTLKGTDTAMDDDACQDCIHIVELLKHLMSDKQFQDKLKSSLDKLCDSLPGKFSAMCHDQVDQKLPLALTILSSIMVPNDVCSYIGLCNGQLKEQIQELLMTHMQKIIEIPTVTQLNASLPCTICTYVVDVLECILPKTETLLITLLGDVCKIFPPLVQGQCTGIVKRYLKMLINILLDIASPDNICSTLRLCSTLQTSETAVFALSDCDSCLTLAVLTRFQFGSNATEPQVASFLRSVCQSHPDVLPKCESFTQRHGHQLQRLLGKEMAALDMCERADLCERKEKSVDETEGDPCTLGYSYSCKDLQTAEECGVVAFCQQNVWNQ